MMTKNNIVHIIYHGKKPLLPLLAGLHHLGRSPDDPIYLLGREHDWRTKPLFHLGDDQLGHKIYCLVHGGHSGLYQRAVQGTASIFGFSLHTANIDHFLEGCAKSNITLYPHYLIAKHLPNTLPASWRNIIFNILNNHFNKWEGQR